MYSLAQAAKAVGKSKPTIARAIKAGKLSAGRGDDGSYVIDPAELARVFPVPGLSTGPMKHYEPGNGIGAQNDSPQAVTQEHEGLRLLLAEREETIRDLRRRLDESETERRRVQERLTALLTHRQSGTVPAVQPTPRRASWWRRWWR
jgi:hypothetical protein